MTLPILYSLRNCPYAMRARIALFKANQPVEVREVKLNNKPAEMLQASAKGTVPILVLGDAASPSSIIEESLEVMLWALTQNDPDDLLLRDEQNVLPNMLKLIARFDDEFKACLNAYKCAKRYKEDNLIECRQACEVFIQELEERLSYTQDKYNAVEQPFIFSARESLVDIALLPFIRQFAKVERQWYLQSPYPKVKQWLNHYLQSVMFTKVMTKFEVWSPTN
ncbi:glutathione S-transferase [Aliiglaciecola sp. 3_MG-2023]|uniref:glutathione S-transferase n=1 Tax=Aliiglaciecola sp. 3_MG-2023 TaxID=3062644 RepID=UPI0026E390A2|nr:glutathione S-transferase [Aliiglaciecola sp. 3_MG-2023]MDO6694951.1 glutathione S-transferase [Aliiglaciecola sp. 3_MG-2023]